MKNLLAIVTPCLLAAAAQAQLSVPYTQNFDSLGPTGTTLTGAGTAGWSVWRIQQGTAWNGPRWDNNTGVLAADLSSGIMVDDTVNASPNNQPLGLFYNADFPTFTRRGGINAGLSTDPNNPNRSLGSSPTGVAGIALQLSLTNDSALPINSLDVSYTMNVLSPVSLAAPGPEELTGYRMFYSLTGAAGTWISASNLDAVSGQGDAAFTSYAISGTINLTATLGVGQTVLLRWVDDNAQQSSPDQMISIDNISVIPTPGAAALLAAGGLATLRRRR